MEFPKQLISATLIKRYQRFLADVRLDDGTMVTAHCPNSGSMKTCQKPGWRVMLSESSNPGRKLKYTWEMVHNGVCWIGINTQVPNKIAAEAITRGRIPELSGYSELRREVRYGANSRVDLLLKNGDQLCYVEVKNVTLVEDDAFYKFPDAVTERGRKHLYDLLEVVKSGQRAVMLFVVQRSDGTIFKPADEIDPLYGQVLRGVHEQGVEILAYRAQVSPQSIELTEKTDYTLD